MKTSLARFLLILGVVTTGQVSAFDRDGFSGGMPIEAALSTLTRSGFNVVRLPISATTETLIFERTGLPGSGSLTFCEGHLSAYVPYIASRRPAILEFANTLEEMTRKFGPGSYRVSAGDSGSAWLQYTWRLPGEVIQLQLGATGAAISGNMGYVEPGTCLDKSTE